MSWPIDITKLTLSILCVGWIQLICTSASLLLPNSDAAADRLEYGLRLFEATSLQNARLRLRLLLHIASTYGLILPLAAYLWTMDEVFFGEYKDIPIRKPVLTISVPRGGTTSFHRTLALDERFATPAMIELVLPFISLQKLVFAMDKAAPNVLRQLEWFLKWINGVTPAVEARHPISLVAPDADDILLGEWHWVAVGAARTFPVAEKWQKNYQMDARERSLELHRRMCQKVLHKHPSRRLLLRSHLSPCVADFQKLYPDATVVGILRDPVDVLRSFAGLSSEALSAATGVELLAADNKDCVSNPWPLLFVKILSDMMKKETELYDGDSGQGNWCGRCHYVTFPEFKADPMKALEGLLQKCDIPMSKQFESAVREGLTHHETYKTRHSYKNPALEAMGITEEQYLSLPGVKRYSELVRRSE